MIEIVRPGWPAPPGVVAGTTLRNGGVSTRSYGSLNLAAHVGDSPEAVRVNRRRFSGVAGLPAEPRWLNQVHGTTIAEAACADAACPPEADGSVTRTAGVVCAVLTADCLPVLFCSMDGTAIGAAHAGWRGLAAGVLDRTVAAISADAGSLLAWLGPAISGPRYEVGGEVRSAFVGNDESCAACFEKNERDRWQADLYALARARLAAIGVVSVYGGDFCTASEPARFFSYRRDGQCGRMASFIYRR